MPRRARIAVPGIPWHIIQRGNNRSACFYAQQDYRRYLETLADMASRYDCEAHAYVLMTNMGRSDSERRTAYQQWFTAQIDPQRIAEIRTATNGNYVLGNDRIK